MAHCMELAVRDALKATTFDMVDDLLIKLYNLYEKSPKKCRELEDIICDSASIALTTMSSNQFVQVDLGGNSML